ncbi:Achaete-scute-like protein 4 [Aphelenchoides fujianensis]|nr:Achaete-scute-like protein 4 [Aphelenchoides fujianensis]
MAPSSSSSSSSSSFGPFGSAIAKRPRPGVKSTLIGKTQHQVDRRNARERKRVEAVNKGYETLAKQIAEWDELKNKKLTKAETLKAAISYIQHLETLLHAPTGQPLPSFDLSPPASSRPLIKTERFDNTADSPLDSFGPPCHPTAHFDPKFHGMPPNYSPSFYPPTYFNPLPPAAHEYGNENQLMAADYAHTNDRRFQ